MKFKVHFEKILGIFGLKAANLYIVIVTCNMPSMVKIIVIYLCEKYDFFIWGLRVPWIYHLYIVSTLLLLFLSYLF